MKNDELRPNTLWLWTTVTDGTEGPLLAVMPRTGSISLVTLNESIAKGAFREIAELHRRQTGERVRLVRYTRVVDVIDLK